MFIASAAEIDCAAFTSNLLPPPPKLKRQATHMVCVCVCVCVCVKGLKQTSTLKSQNNYKNNI